MRCNIILHIYSVRRIRRKNTDIRGSRFVRIIYAERDQAVIGHIGNIGSIENKVAAGAAALFGRIVIRDDRNARKARIVIFKIIFESKFVTARISRTIRNMVYTRSRVKVEYLIVIPVIFGNDVIRALFAQIHIAEIEIDIFSGNYGIIFTAADIVAEENLQARNIGRRYMVAHHSAADKIERIRDMRPCMRGKRPRFRPCKLQRNDGIARIVYVEIEIAVIFAVNVDALNIRQVNADIEFTGGRFQSLIYGNVRKARRIALGNAIRQICRRNVFEIEPSVFAGYLFYAESVFKIHERIFHDRFGPAERNGERIIFGVAVIIFQMENDLVITAVVFDLEAAVHRYVLFHQFGIRIVLRFQPIDGNHRFPQIEAVRFVSGNIIPKPAEKIIRESVPLEYECGRFRLDKIDGKRRVFHTLGNIYDIYRIRFAYNNRAVLIRNIIAVFVFNGLNTHFIPAQNHAVGIHHVRDRDLIFTDLNFDCFRRNVDMSAVFTCVARNEHARQKKTTGQCRQCKQVQYFVFHRSLLLFHGRRTERVRPLLPKYCLVFFYYPFFNSLLLFIFRYFFNPDSRIVGQFLTQCAHISLSIFDASIPSYIFR